MAEQSFEEKTEKPTPQKREEVRKKGEVAKSRELPSVAVLLSGLITLSIFGSFMITRVREMTEKIFMKIPAHDLDAVGLIDLGRELIILFLVTMTPLLSVIFLTAVLSNVMQVGLMASIEQIKPKISKVNPLKGLQRLFSAQSLMELVKALMKLAIVGGVATLAFRAEIERVPSLVDMEIVSITTYIFVTMFRIILKCTLAMLVLVVADYAFQKWQFEKRIRMTQKEIKDEFKKTEGDPLVKSRIRSIQMEMARKRMMQDVPKADVVVTNPTHFAVAVRYDGIQMGAPQVIAKGADHIARRIKEIAREHQIPIVENKELARNLYSVVEIGHEIPASLYQAMAEVLAYIYRLKTARRVS